MMNGDGITALYAWFCTIVIILGTISIFGIWKILELIGVL